MNFIKIIRSAEWWEYKLPPLLAIGYATVIKSGRGFMDSIPHLIFLLIAIIVGAIYVSIINDLTDLKDDLASGKSNRMVGIRSSIRWLLPLLCIIAGFACGYYLYPDWLSVTMYLIPWLAFSMYSFPPLRLKNRGIWGVLADASGSHIFTSLLMVSSLTYFTHQSMDWLWFAGTAIWALCYGLRGILWHQFQDRLNDMKANVKTFAVKISPVRFKLTEQIIFFIELIAVACMLYRLHQPLTLIFLLVYIIIALTRTFKLRYKPVLILTPLGKPYHILMADFYQVYFPLSLLIIATLGEAYAGIVLCIHFVLFPKNTLTSLKDLKQLITYR